MTTVVLNVGTLWFHPTIARVEALDQQLQRGNLHCVISYIFFEQRWIKISEIRLHQSVHHVEQNLSYFSVGFYVRILEILETAYVGVVIIN